MALADPLRDAELLIRSGHPLLFVESLDRPRVQALLRHLADRMGFPLFRWSRSRGIVRLDRDGSIYKTEEPEKALRHIAASDQPALYFMKGLETLLPGSPLVQAKFVEALDQLQDIGGAIIGTGERPELSPALSLRATTVRLPGPTREELRQLLAHILRDMGERKKVTVELARREMEQLLDQLSGLTLMESEKILTRALLEDGRLGPEDLRHVADAKRRVIEEDGLLEYTPVEESFAEIAGLAGLKRWLARRTALIRDPEGGREYGLQFPRGILLAGVPGCGKSLCARAVATEWQLPLLRMDPAGLFNRYIGETERNLRRALDLAEEMAPVVLWIDELEKAFASAGGSQDGGVSRRVLGTFLSWMQEHRSEVFIFATANDVDQLPAELMRKGRFDELFFVDLPDEESRAEIVRIHLRNRNQDPGTVDAAAVARAARDFSGAELEQVVVSALYAAFADRGSVTTESLVAEVGETRPLAVTARERIQRLRSWAEGRTVLAN